MEEFIKLKKSEQQIGKTNSQYVQHVPKYHAIFLTIYENPRDVVMEQVLSQLRKWTIEAWLGSPIQSYSYPYPYPYPWARAQTTFHVVKTTPFHKRAHSVTIMATLQSVKQKAQSMLWCAELKLIIKKQKLIFHYFLCSYLKKNVLESTLKQQP